MLEYPALLIFPIAMVYAASMDLFTMTIPNRVSLALIAGFFPVAILGGVEWLEIAKHTGVGLGMLAISVLMFSRGWIGGGDAKLLAAVSLWLGLDHLLDYVILTAILGGVLTTAILSFRTMVPAVFISGQAWLERLHDKKGGVPYGIALGAAGMLVYPKSQIFQAFAV